MKIETNRNADIFLDLSKQVVGDMRMRVEQSEKTQAALADDLNVDRSAISKTLSENTNLTLRKVADIAAATGSRCYFRMIPERSAEESGSEIAMVSASKMRAASNKKRGKSVGALIEDAADYIREVLNADDYAWEESYHANARNDLDKMFGDQFQKDADAFIHVFHDDQNANPAEIVITPEFTFTDGFSDVEWVLNDTLGAEYFRSRDLRQVAQLAEIIISRGGFKI